LTVKRAKIILLCEKTALDRIVMNTTPKTDRVLPLRKLIHLAGAAFPLIYLVVPRQTMLVIVLIALFLTGVVEWGRQRWTLLERLFELIIGPALRRGEEQKPTTGMWSMLAIVISIWAFKREFAIPAMLFAQLGDPVAEIVGRRWGRHRLPNGKSLEGSLGCFTTNLIIGLACAKALSISPGMALVGALAAAVTEAAPLPLGDNLLMAPISGLAMTLIALLVG
jgi:dolichol kinase